MTIFDAYTSTLAIVARTEREREREREREKRAKTEREGERERERERGRERGRELIDRRTVDKLPSYTSRSRTRRTGS